MSNTIIASAAVLLVTACSSKATRESTTPTVTVTVDSVSSTGSMSIDSTTDALSEGTDAGGTRMVNGMPQNIDLKVADVDVTITRTCTVDKPAAGNVQVIWSRNGTGSVEKTRRNWTVTSALTAAGSETRDWIAPAGKSLACNAMNGVQVDWADATLVNGLKLNATIDRSHAMASEWSNTRSGKTRKITHAIATKGTRSTTWGELAVATAAGTTTITSTKSVVLDHTAVATTPTEDGGTTNHSAAIRTDETAPLVVTSIRTGNSPSLTTLASKTVTSGVIISTDLSDGAVTTVKLSNVKYDLSATNSDKCVPVSGTLTGAVYSELAAKTPLKTFVITFGDSNSATDISVAYDGAEASDYNYSYTGCDLAREL